MAFQYIVSGHNTLLPKVNLDRISWSDDFLAANLHNLQTPSSEVPEDLKDVCVDAFSAAIVEPTPARVVRAAFTLADAQTEAEVRYLIGLDGEATAQLLSMMQVGLSTIHPLWPLLAGARNSNVRYADLRFGATSRYQALLKADEVHTSADAFHGLLGRAMPDWKISHLIYLNKRGQLHLGILPTALHFLFFDVYDPACRVKVRLYPDRCPDHEALPLIQNQTRPMTISCTRQMIHGNRHRAGSSLIHDIGHVIEGIAMPEEVLADLGRIAEKILPIHRALRPDADASALEYLYEYITDGPNVPEALRDDMAWIYSNFFEMMTWDFFGENALALKAEVGLAFAGHPHVEHMLTGIQSFIDNTISPAL